MSRLKDRLLNYHIQVKKFADDDQMILANDVLSMIEQLQDDLEWYEKPKLTKTEKSFIEALDPSWSYMLRNGKGQLYLARKVDSMYGSNFKYLYLEGITIAKFDFIEAENYLRTHLFCGLWMCIVSYLETSRIPTISLKKTKINASMIIPLLIIVALMANFLFTQTWLTLGVLTALYTLSIPLGVLKFLKDKRDFQKAQAVSEQI